MQTTRTRNPSLDLLRCTALFGVVFVHFFAKTGYYGEPVQGTFMYVSTLLRSAAMVCVPLFILLSGYLMSEKKLSASYFKQIEKTLVIYVLASIFCGIYTVCDRVFVLGKHAAVPTQILGIFSFSTASYAWYVEMYIGLYFLIPFLNILYHGLPGKKEKQCLLLVLLCSTALPQILNIHNVYSLSWWLQPSTNSAYQQLIPGWWTNLYPLTYYFLGCYLKEFPLALSQPKKLALFFLSVLCNGSFNYYRSMGSSFIWGIWQDWGSLFNLIQSVLLFDLLLHLDLTGIPKKAQTLLAKMSDCCFGAYLVSWVFDQIVYPLLKKYPSFHQKFPFIVIVVPIIFLFSLIVSAALNGLYQNVRRRLFRQKII